MEKAKRNFNNDIKIEKKYEPIAREYIAEELGIDINDIDFLGNLNEGIKDKYDYLLKDGRKVEVKVREKDYGDMLIEYQSTTPLKQHNDSRGLSPETKPGWIAKESGSKADIFFYLIIENNKIKAGKIFDMPKLKEWYWKNKIQQKYPKKFSENEGYKTHFNIVPYNVIPEECYYKNKVIA